MTKKHDIIWLDEVISTNIEARNTLSDADKLSVVSALSQTHGRGQGGNTWLSPKGMNLTFSIALKNPQGLKGLSAYDQFVISEATALAAVEFLSNHGIDASIKWPNDIYVNDSKIAGILIENSIKGQNLDHSIIGIGINVNQTDFDASLPNPTSMKAITGQNYDIHQLLKEFMDIFVRYIDYCYFSKGHVHLRILYISKLWRRDMMATYIEKSTDMQFKGVIKKVTQRGLLVIETEEGELKEFAFNEISYVI